MKHLDGQFKTALSIYYENIIFPGKIRAEILRAESHVDSVDLSEGDDFHGGANVPPLMIELM